MPRLKKSRHLTQTALALPPPDRKELAPVDAHLPRMKLTLRLFRGEDIAMGPGKAQLLEAIIRTGSISAAGRTMEMSYRRAWLLVDEMNRCFKQRIVSTAKGGKAGGGAEVTPFGLEMLRKYQEMVVATHRVAHAYVGLFKDLLSEDTQSPTDAAILPRDS
jgi:molybdate transport system regulatory protein